MKKYKLIIYTLSNRSNASTRYRILQYLPQFEKHGISFKVLEPSDKLGKGIRRVFKKLSEENFFFNALGEAGMALIQRRLFTKKFLGRLEKSGKPIIFDFDDAIFTSPNGDWSYLRRRKVLGRLIKTIQISDWVIAGNSYLKSFAQKAGARKVLVLPTVVEPEKYPIKQHSVKYPIVLGWIGSSPNYPYLNLLSDVLPILVREFPQVKLLVVSDKKFRLEGITVENRSWSEDKELDDLLEMDIGLMPLADNNWTRGKCAFKALQYMAAGIPAVCSDVGSNREVVEDGVNGFLVRNKNEWLQALRELIRSPEKRTAMGLEGRKKVEQNFNLNKTAEILTSILENL